MADASDDTLSDRERQLGRRELFEKMVMVPVSFGMLAASATYFAHGRHNDIIVPLSIAVAATAFLIAAVRRRRG